MRGSQDMPSETGQCFSVDFSHPTWDEEVPHCRLFSPAARKGLSSLEICLRLFSPIYSTMLIDRSGAFTALKADVSRTGGNV